MAILPAATDEFPIPAFAKSLQILSQPNNTTLDVEMRLMDGTVIATYTLAAYPSDDLPIPNGVTSVRLRNIGLVACTYGTLIFKLAL
jgi:hypothetical protein